MTTTPSPSPQLSREEQLAIWLEKKGKKPRKSSFSSTQSSSRAHKTPVRHTNLGSAQRLSNKSYSAASSTSFEGGSRPPSCLVTVKSSRARSPYLAAGGEMTRVSTTNTNNAAQRLTNVTNITTTSSSTRSATPSFVTTRRRPLSSLPTREGRLLAQKSVRTSAAPTSTTVMNRKSPYGLKKQKPNNSVRQTADENADDNNNVVLVPKWSAKSTEAGPCVSRKSAAAAAANSSCDDASSQRANDNLIGMVVAIKEQEILSPVSIASRTAKTPGSTVDIPRSSKLSSPSAFHDGSTGFSSAFQSIEKAQGTETDGRLVSTTPRDDTTSFNPGERAATVLQDDEDDLDWRNALEDEPSDNRQQRRRREDSILQLHPPAPEALDTPSARDEQPEENETSPETSSSRDTDHDETDNHLHVPREVLRATDTGKAVLESIPEVGAGWHHGRDSSEQQSDEIVELRSQVESLRLENKKLDGQLQAIRKAHEERVTPFRNVFDEMRKLREVNEMLRKEKQESEASVQKIVDDLKAQMMTGLSAAVAKTQALQKQLDEVRGERDELERRLASCQSEQQ